MRDIDAFDMDAIETSIEGAFKEIKKKSGNDHLVAVTGAAKGFDLLVYRVARRMGIPHVTVLTQSVESFKAGHGDVVGLDDALLNSFNVLILDEFMTKSGDVFTKGYRGLGQFLSVYSDVLIAFWDHMSDDPIKPGGTEDVIEMRKGNIRYEKVSDELKAYGGFGALAIIKAQTCDMEWVVRIQPDKFRNHFNKHLSKLHLNKKAVDVTSFEALKGELSKLSGRFKRNHQSFLIGFMSVLGIGVLSFELYGIFTYQMLIGAYILSVLTIFIINMGYGKWGNYDHYLQSRLYNELLRISIHLKGVGFMGNLVNMLSVKNDYATRNSQGMFNALYLMNLLSDTSEQSQLDRHGQHGENGQCSQHIGVGGWFKSQIKYMHHSVQVQNNQIKKIKVIKPVVTIISFLIIAGSVMIADPKLQNICITLSGLLTALGALYVMYLESHFNQHIVDGYLYMQDVYHRGLKRAQTILETDGRRDSMKEERELAYEIANIALEEIIDWVQIRNENKGNSIFL